MISKVIIFSRLRKHNARYYYSSLLGRLRCGCTLSLSINHAFTGIFVVASQFLAHNYTDKSATVCSAVYWYIPVSEVTARQATSATTNRRAILLQQIIDSLWTKFAQHHAIELEREQRDKRLFNEIPRGSNRNDKENCTCPRLWAHCKQHSQIIA